jgi:hypothetical protein
MTCRFCTSINGAMIRYAKRHHAHLECAVKAKGKDWVTGLFTWQLQGLPFMEVHRLGLDSVVQAELERRSHLNTTGRTRLDSQF